jgi:hypothetical protein
MDGGPSLRDLDPPFTKKRKASPGIGPGESEPTASSFSREHPLVGGGDSSSAEAAAAMIDTAVATTKGMAASPPKASSDGDPPDSRRYWPLWTEYGNGATKVEDILPARSESTQAKQQQRKEGDSTMWTAADEGQWKDEKELFAYNLFMRDKIEARRGQIDQYKQDMEDIRQKCRHDLEGIERQIKRCEAEIREIGQQVDRATIVPRARWSGPAFWRGLVPKHIQHDAELAWLLVRSSQVGELSVPLQRMLWTDPRCPLRSDRALLMASLDKFLDHSVKIVWSHDMANDRELVMKCIDRCPRSVRAWTAAARAAENDGVSDNGGDSDSDDSENDESDSEDSDENEIRAAAVEGCELPDAYFDDMEMLRAYAFPVADGRLYRNRRSEYRYEPQGFHTRFSPALLLDPQLMVDLLVLLCTSEHDEAWAGSVVRGAFRVGATPDGHPFLDNEDFALRLARATAEVADRIGRDHRVSYASLSGRVRAIPDVALAFVAADGSNVNSLPIELSSDAELWTKIYQVATDNYPPAIYCKRFNAEAFPGVLSSKALALRLVEAAKRYGPNSGRGDHRDLERMIRAFPDAIRRDPEFNMQLVALGAENRAKELYKHYDPGCVQECSFWIELSERHRCPCSAWACIPAHVSTDADVVLNWARHAYPDVSIEWLLRADENFLHLRLMSDRQVLINWIPTLSDRMRRNNPTADAVYDRASPALLDKAFWMELLSKGMPSDCFSCMPGSLRHEPDIVDAQLRCCLNAEIEHDFLNFFATLPPHLQRQFSRRLVEAIQRADVSLFKRRYGNSRTCIWEREQAPEMWHVPDVALAAISKGWTPTTELVKASPWSGDPAFLISVAKALPKKLPGNCDYIVWHCCSDALRRDKEFILEVLKLDCVGIPPHELDDDLKNDFDVMRVMQARASEYDFFEPTKRDLEFIGKVRERLELSLSLEVFMRGIRSSRVAPALVPPGPTCALTILNQDGYTLEALRRRLVEYLGAPSREEVAELRIVSRKFTKYGY